MPNNKAPTHFSARKRLIVVAIAACFASAPAWANPTVPQVINGSASFNQAGKLLTVTNSPGAIINWNTFSIAAGETTRFKQASTASNVLNRVLANDPSVLLGTLSSNGRVWLVNPAGIMVGQGARIDVGGFIASTLNIRNEDFLAGRLNFQATPNAGKVENYGQITTPSGGSVYLIAPAVENHGIINAPNGEVILAAGQTAQLIDTGTPGVKVDITGAEGNVTNLGQIVADAGRIGMAGVLVKNSGAVNASSVVTEGGRIFLKAAQKIELTGTSVISADGTKGGQIVAKVEDGGQLSGNLIASGELLARGDGTKGSGGFVETSAKTANINSVRVNTRGGSWLLDPDDVEIHSTGTVSGATLVTPTTIQNALVNNNFVVETNAAGTGGSGDIILNEAVSWNSANSLTLNAIRHVDINQAIINSGSGSVSLRADSAGTCVAGAVTACGTVNFTSPGHVTAATTNIYYNPIGSNTAADANGLGPSYTTQTGYTGNVTGVLNAYMLVNDANQLQAMNTNVAGRFALGKNIDATATAAWNLNSSVYSGFMPVGDGTNNFTGVFDGLGHTISGLTINRSTDHAGLFGYAGGASAIKNVGLVGGSVTGNDFVGGLVGRIDFGNGVSGSYFTGTVTGNAYVGGLVGLGNSSSVSNVYASGNVSASGGAVGGLMGHNNYGSVSNAYATGNVSGGSCTGGLLGCNYGTVSNVYATGSVSGTTEVGGLVGYNNNYGHISNAYATGRVSGNTNVGGLVGWTYSGGSVSNSYWDKQTTGQTVPVGLDDGTTSATIGLANVDMMKASTFAGWSLPTTWNIVEGKSYPYFNWRFATPPQVVSGALSGLANNAAQPVSMVTGGIQIGQASTGANGFYYTLLDAGTVSSSAALLNYVPGAALSEALPAAHARASDNGDYAGMNLTPAKFAASTTGTVSISNGKIAAARANLSDAGIPFAADGNHLTFTPGVSFETARGTSYVLDGDISTTGGGNLTFDGPLGLSTSASLSAGASESAGGNISITEYAPVTTGGRDISLIAGGTVNVTSSIDTTSSAADANAGNVTVTANGMNGGMGNNISIHSILANGMVNNDTGHAGNGGAVDIRSTQPGTSVYVGTIDVYGASANVAAQNGGKAGSVTVIAPDYFNTDSIAVGNINAYGGMAYLGGTGGDGGSVTLGFTGSGIGTIVGGVIDVSAGGAGNQAGAAGSVAFESALGSISLGAASVVGGALTVTAGNQISRSDGTIVAKDLILSAVNGIGGGPESGNPLHTQVSNLQATNTNNGIAIHNTGDLTLKDLEDVGYAVRNTNGAVLVTAHAGNEQPGNLTVSSSVMAGKRFSLWADGDLFINADVSGTAAGGNPTSELIADASHNGTGGITQNATAQIKVTESATEMGSVQGNLDVGVVCAPGGGCGSGTGGSSQNIVLGAVNVGMGTVRIRTESGGIQDSNGTGTLNVTAGDLVLRSERGVDLDTAVSRVAVRNGLDEGAVGDVLIRNVNGGTLSLESLFFGGLQSIKNGGGAIRVTNDGSINIANDVDSGTARTTLRAGNTIDDGEGGGIIYAGNLVLSAVNGIGGGPSSMLQTQVANLQATNTNNGIAIHNTGDLTLKDLEDVGYAVGNTNGAVLITANAGNEQPGTLTVGNSVMAGKRFSLRADGDVLVNANLTGTGLGGNSTSELIADADNNGMGGIAQNATSQITITDGGNLNIGVVCAPGGGCGSVGGSTAQNIVLGTVNAGTGTVMIRTVEGGIQDANGAGTLNITAGDLVVRSEQGIDLDTAVSRVDLFNGYFSNAGNIAIRNAGNLTVDNVYLNKGVLNPGGTVTLTTTGALAINSSVNSGTARTTLSAGDQISQSGGTIIAGDLHAKAATGIDLTDVSAAQLSAYNTDSRDINITAGSGGLTTINSIFAPGYAIQNLAPGGNVNLTANSMNLADPGLISAPASVVLRPAVSWTGIDLGNTCTGECSSALRLTGADLLRISAPTLQIGDTGSKGIPSGPISVNAPIVFSPAVGSLIMKSAASIWQDAASPITVSKLALDAGYDVSMQADNMVGTLAGTVGTLTSATTYRLAFNNAQTLAIGSVGEYYGLQVDGGEGASINLAVTGGSLAINRSLSANGGAYSYGAPSTVSLSASAGIAIDGSLGGSVAANGSSSGYSYGGRATVTLDGGTGGIALNNALVRATGGDASSSYGTGGAATVTLTASGNITIPVGSYIEAYGGSAYNSGGPASVVVTSANGSIALGGDISAIANAASSIALTATNGAIVGEGGMLSASSYGDTPAITLTALNGIGQAGSPIRFWDANSSVTATNTGSGDIALSQVTGDLMISDFNGITNLAPNGGYDFTAESGSMAVSGILAANSSGNIGLHVLASDNSLTLSEGANLSTPSGTINLTAPYFYNHAASDPLSTTSGRWLIWVANPTRANLGTGGLTESFRQYVASYGTTAPAVSGNGLMFSDPAYIAAELSGTTSKVYDGSKAASGLTLIGSTVYGDSLGTTFGYIDKNVGTAKIIDPLTFASPAVTYNGIPVYGVSIGLPAGGDVTARALSVTATGVGKIYDGLKSASVSYADNRVAGDQLTIGNGAASYLDKNVGIAKPVDVSGITLSGTDAANYAFNTTATTSADITARSLNITAAGVNKVYDGLTSATVTYADNRVTGDVLTANGSASFGDKNIGAAKPVGVSGISLGGTDAGNYTFNTTATTAADITARALNITAAGVNKVYDGLTSATVTYADNRVTGDVLTASGSASFGDKNVGAGKPVSVSGISLGGTDAGNYAFNTTTTTAADITVRPFSTWSGGTTGNWSVASNWDALPDLSNVLAVTVPAGKTVTYDAAVGTTNLTTLTAGGLTMAGGSLNIADRLTADVLSITGGSLNIAKNLAVSSSFNQTGGTLGDFGAGSRASITQVSGNLNLPQITVANLSLNAPAGAITQSGRLAALTLKTQSEGATTLNNPDNQITGGRVDMKAGGPLILWASGGLNLGAIDAGASSVEIKAGGAILKALGTESSTNIVGASADLASIFGGTSGNLAISADTQVTGALVATVGSATALAGQEADFGGIRIKNTGAQPASVTLTDNALAGAGVSFLNTGSITSTSGLTLETLKGSDLALLSNGDITWNGGKLNTPSGSAQISADGSIAVTGALSAPVDLALSSKVAINVSGSVTIGGTGTAAFTAPSVAINGSVNAADDVGIIADTLNLGSGSSTRAGHDAIFAAGNITATNATVFAAHDISAAVTGDMRLNASGFNAGNDIFVNMLGATSTLYLNDAAGLPRSFLWAQAPSTVYLNYPARAYEGSMVVDGVEVNPLTYGATASGSGLFYGPSMTPAKLGAGLEAAFGTTTPEVETAPSTIVNAVVAAVTSSSVLSTLPTTTQPLQPIGSTPPPTTGLGGTSGSTGVGGTEGTFGASSGATGGTDSGGAGGTGDSAKKDDKDDKDKDKKDTATGIKKQEDKPTAKKLATCS